VVRNHGGGTGLRGWNPRGRSDDFRVGVGVDAARHVDGGAKRRIVRYSYRAVWTNPGEKAVESARTKGEAPKWSVGEGFASSGSFGDRPSEPRVEDPADVAGDGEIEGGAGKTNDLLHRRTGRTTRIAR